MNNLGATLKGGEKTEKEKDKNKENLYLTNLMAKQQQDVILSGAIAGGLIGGSIGGGGGAIAGAIIGAVLAEMAAKKGR